MILRCPDCRTRRTTRGLFTRHVRETGHKLCRCGGYHYQHRPGSPLCAYNPLSALRLADRDGAALIDMLRKHYPGIVGVPPALAPKVQALLEDWKIDVQHVR